MTTIVTRLPDEHIVVSLPGEGYKGRPVSAQGQGHFDPTTKTVFFKFHGKLIPLPILGEFELREIA